MDYPGVYELLLKDKATAPRSIGVAYVETGVVGKVIEFKGQKYTILTRSGLPPTGQLVLKARGPS